MRNCRSVTIISTLQPYASPVIANDAIDSQCQITYMIRSLQYPLARKLCNVCAGYRVIHAPRGDRTYVNDFAVLLSAAEIM